MSIITDNPTDRVMFFIDLRNNTKVVSKYSNFSRLDFIRMVELLNRGRNTKRAYVFDGASFEDGYYNDSFHKFLRYNGFTVNVAGYTNPEQVQKGVDVMLACKMLRHALDDDYDVAILVAGDGDYVPLVEEVKSAGKKVEVAAFEDAFSKPLQMAADMVHFLDFLPIIKMDQFQEVPMEPMVDVIEAEEVA